MDNLDVEDANINVAELEELNLIIILIRFQKIIVSSIFTIKIK